MKSLSFLLHALSPLHAGTGHAADVIDLPTARYKATGIPFMPGSSIKGVLRDARRQVDRERTEAVFGPSDDPAAHAGALVVGDARLLALPVRSFRGTFAWTTSPLLLTLAKRDLDEANLSIPVSLDAGRLPGRDMAWPAHRVRTWCGLPGALRCAGCPGGRRDASMGLGSGGFGRPRHLPRRPLHPEGGADDRPFAADVLTVHQKGYYDSSGGSWPNDYTAPTRWRFSRCGPARACSSKALALITARRLTSWPRFAARAAFMRVP
jgi:hypothetical protein